MDSNLIFKFNFLKKCKTIKQEFSGHSNALRYVCENDNNKYFVKIYDGNNLEQIKNIDSIYKRLNIPTAKVIQASYFSDVSKTFVVYEYIEGKELIELTNELTLDQIEKIGFEVGKNLSKFKVIKCDKQKLINLYEKEFESLIDALYLSKDFLDKSQKLCHMNLDRLCNSFLECKKYIYKNEPTFIHGDINLHNVIFQNGKTYFIDTSNGKNSFRSLDFRGNCWFGWDGDNILNEQAMYRGIYKGLFKGKIPNQFNKELAFTIMYEFLLKINDGYMKNDIGKLEYIFCKFGDIFDKTNYFENYKFEWFE